MRASPNCGVSCYNHESMVMCNAHMLINNRLHDRLYGTGYAATNDACLATVDTNLTVNGENRPPVLLRHAAERQGAGHKEPRPGGRNLVAVPN